MLGFKTMQEPGAFIPFMIILPIKKALNEARNLKKWTGAIACRYIRNTRLSYKDKVGNIYTLDYRSFFAITINKNSSLSK